MIEVKLRDLLERFELNRRGVVEEMSRATGLHRQSIGKICADPNCNVSLEVLRKIAHWLSARGVPEAALRELFDVQPSSLEKALVRPQRIDFYLPVKAMSKIFKAKFRDEMSKSDLYSNIPQEVWNQE